MIFKYFQQAIKKNTLPKILRIINRLNLGGPTYNVCNLTHYLKPKYETLLVSGVIDDSEASSEFILNKFDIKPVYIPEMKREINFKQDIIAYRRIKNIIQDFKPDIVHTHAAKAGALGRLAASSLNVPCVVHTFHGHVFHSYFSPLKTQFFIQVERYLASKSSAIVAISEKQKEELVNTYRITNDQKTHVVPLGFDLDRFQFQKEIKRSEFRKKYLLNDDEIAITIIGRLVPVKNHQLLLNTLAKIKHQFTQKVRVFIVGDGELMQQLQDLCVSLDLNFTLFNTNPFRSFITFTSWIFAIDEVLAGVDLVVLTSLNEGTPVSIIEAQAAGKPVITTQVGGVENIVLPQSAILAPSNNSQALAAALLDCVNNKEKLQSMNNSAIQHMFDKFSYQTLSQNMDNLYEKLLSK